MTEFKRKAIEMAKEIKIILWIPFIGIFYFSSRYIGYKIYVWWMIYHLLFTSIPLAIIIGVFWFS